MWAASGYVALFVETGVGVAISILVVRALSITEFGAYKLAGAIIMIGTYLTSCGLDATVQRFGAEMISRRHVRGLERLLVWARIIRVLALLAFFLVVLGLKAKIGDFFAFPDILMDGLLLVYGILCVQSGIGIFGYSLFSARHAFVDASFLRVMVALLKLGGFVVVFLLGLGFVGALGALFVASAIGLAYAMARNQLWMSQWRRSTLPAAQVDGGYSRRIVRFAFLGYVAMNVNVFRDLSIDSLVITHFLGANQVALYGLASTLFMFANAMNPAALLRGVVTPLLVSRHAEGGGMDELVSSFRLLSKAVMLLHWPLVTLLLVLGREVISLVYSPAFGMAYEPLLVLCVSAYFLGLTYPFVPVVVVLEKNSLVVMAGIVAIYNLLMVIALVPRFGIAGAAFATGSAALLQLALYWAAFRFVFAVPLTFPFGMLPRMVLNLAAPIGVALVAKMYIDDVADLLATMSLCGVAYLALVYWNNGFDSRELALLRRYRVRGAS